MNDARNAAARLGAITRLALLGSDGAAARFAPTAGGWRLTAEGRCGAASIDFVAAHGWRPDGLTDLVGVRPLGPDRLELRFVGPTRVELLEVSGHRLVSHPR